MCVCVCVCGVLACGGGGGGGVEVRHLGQGGPTLRERQLVSVSQVMGWVRWRLTCSRKPCGLLAASTTQIKQASAVISANCRLRLEFMS